MTANQCCWFILKRGLTALIYSFIAQQFNFIGADEPFDEFFSPSFSKCRKDDPSSCHGTEDFAIPKKNGCEEYSACPDKAELWLAWDGTTEWRDTQDVNSPDYYKSFANSVDYHPKVEVQKPMNDDRVAELVANNIKLQSIVVDHMLKGAIHRSTVDYMIETLQLASSRGFWERKYQFLSKYLGYNIEVSDIYNKELKRLNDFIYLDWAGAGLYQVSQISSVYEDLATHAYANAHSRSPAAIHTDETIREARRHILRFLNAPQDQYACIFTAGATSALKLVGETFPWTKESKFFYLRINHTSVVGVRQYATAAGASFKALSYEDIESILKAREIAGKKNSGKRLCLFAFPGKDNFVGHEYPMDWIARIKNYGLDSECRFQIMIDAAAMAASKPLNLAYYPADYVALSFYKLIGYPTGIGALIAKKEEQLFLQKGYFGGGSIVAASCDSEWCQLKQDIPSRLEDGTVSFLAVAALKYGLAKLEYFGMSSISEHIACLTDHLVTSLSQLQHGNGTPVVHIYGLNRPLKGGIVTFNIVHPNGTYYSFGQVEVDAANVGIQLRGGCFCNPGGCQDYMKLTDNEMKQVNVERRSCSDTSRHSVKKPIGAVRISLGYLSRFEDTDALYMFIKNKYLEP